MFPAKVNEFRRQGTKGAVLKTFVPLLFIYSFVVLASGSNARKVNQIIIDL